MKRNNWNNNFERDLIHPSIIAKHSIITEQDLLIGSGFLFNIKDFISDLYTLTNLPIDDLVNFDESNNLLNIRKTYYSNNKFSTYNELLTLTIKEIYEN